MPDKKANQLIGLALALALEAPLRPKWAYYRIRSYLYHHILDKRHQKHATKYSKNLMPWTDAVRYVTHSEREPVAWTESLLLDRMIVTDRWVAGFNGMSKTIDAETTGPIELNYGPSPIHMRIVNQICRQLRPQYVVEAGVGRGFASASVLDALKFNGFGSLHSIELPGLRRGYREQIGEMIPAEYQDFWTLHFGPSAVELPRVLAAIPAVDVYIHDSSANYDTQITEFSLAIQKMGSGGVLIAGQLNNDAFFEVAESAHASWAAIDQGKPFPMGILAIP